MCTVQAKFSRLFADNPDKIFGTIFGHSSIVLRFGFDPGTDVFGFCGVFWYPNNLVTNREGTRGALFYVGPRFEVYYHCKILNNMLLCVKIMLIYAI